METNESNGYQAYALFNAIKLHFTGSYDFHKYDGKTKVTKEQFMVRKDKFNFYKLSRKYKNDELFHFYIANVLNNPKLWSGDLLSEEADSIYKEWTKRNQSLTYVFEQDLCKLFDDVDNPDNILKVDDGQYPKLYTYYLQGEIQLETIVILNSFLNFFPMWKKKVHDDIVFPNFLMICEKYKPFLNYDTNKFKKIIRNKICQNA